MNIIFIEELKVKVTLGVPAWERLKPQTILIDIEMALATDVRFSQDNIAETIDYAEICKTVSQLLQMRPFQLVETMAELVCQHILQDYPATWAKVKIRKPNVLPQAKFVGVILQRGQRPD